MAVTIVFETHSISVDNERGVASGWTDGPLSERGRAFARELGDRRRDDGLRAVFSSDLRRSRETVELAFAGEQVPVLLDWRLRECDYGDLDGGPAGQHVRDRRLHIDQRYPNGESWREAVERVRRFLSDLPSRWDGDRVLVVGHVATRWALDHYLDGVQVEELAASDFEWKEGWEYRLDATTAPG